VPSTIITFDQNWHNLYSSFAGGKDLSSDTKIGVIGQIKPEMCTKMPRNLSEKLAAKCPATTLSYSMVGIACGKDTFSEIFDLEASPAEDQSLPPKNYNMRKRKGEKNIKRTCKPKDRSLSNPKV